MWDLVDLPAVASRIPVTAGTLRVWAHRDRWPKYGIDERRQRYNWDDIAVSLRRRGFDPDTALQRTA